MEIIVKNILCPKCFDRADAIAIGSDEEVILWGCRSCNFQGDYGSFIEFSSKTDRDGPKEDH